MENKWQENGQEFPSTGVFKLPGEPAIVINGVPDLGPPAEMPTGTNYAISDAESNRKVCFGKWLEGREVRKLFGDQYFCGKVTKYDEETGWYRVAYEDGDFEDLEWHELEEALLPLDVMVPMKALAQKILRKSHKHIPKYKKRMDGGR